MKPTITKDPGCTPGTKKSPDGKSCVSVIPPPTEAPSKPTSLPQVKITLEKPLEPKKEVKVEVKEKKVDLKVECPPGFTNEECVKIKEQEGKPVQPVKP